MLKVLNQSRWQSVPTWLAIVGALGILAQVIFKVSPTDMATANVIINVILGLLVTLGVLNNGTNPNGIGANTIPPETKVVPIDAPIINITPVVTVVPAVTDTPQTDATITATDPLNDQPFSESKIPRR